jgi:hypothetical protein
VTATAVGEILWKMPLLPAHQRYRTVSLRTAVSVAGKRIFEVRDKEPERASKVQERRCRDKISLNDPAHSGPIRRDLGNLRSAESAWWGWKDSNLQTRDYELAFRPTLQALILPGLSNRLTTDFSTGLQAQEERACEIEGTVETSMSMPVSPALPGLEVVQAPQSARNTGGPM